MTLQPSHTLSAISDEIVQIFSMINYGELYYKRITAACYYNNEIQIDIKHLESIKDLISPLSIDNLKKAVDDALYNFLNSNTAYGFADWARKHGRLKWRLA